jgi:5-methyltetrahydrofolate--homocysteine methyltransferase
MSEEKQKKLKEAIINLQIDTALKICEETIASGIAMEKIFDSITQAMNIVGTKYEAGEYFLAELIMAGEIVKDILKVIEPYYKKSERKFISKVVLATVKGDLHDIGKNIVSMLLQSAGFEVYDLGIDVSAEKIVEAVKKYNIQIVGLSALLTTTLPEIKNIIEELKKAGLRDKVKIIVGGAALNDKVAKMYGADSYAKTAVEGLKICKEWISYQRGK